MCPGAANIEQLFDRRYAVISRIRQRSVDALGIRRTALLYGAATAAVFWCVWYFTKIPCTPHNAAAGLCNPGWLARFINAEILALAVGAGIAIGSVKGGYDYYMLKNMINQETGRPPEDGAGTEGTHCRVTQRTVRRAPAGRRRTPPSR